MMTGLEIVRRIYFKNLGYSKEMVWIKHVYRPKGRKLASRERERERDGSLSFMCPRHTVLECYYGKVLLIIFSYLYQVPLS